MSGIALLIARTLLAVILYTFLGWALFTLWQSLRQQKKTIENQQPPEIWLVIKMEGSTQNRQFRGSEITLGRDPTCECALSSETVSARHARFSFHHAQWWLEDLKSTNGTFLNGDPIQTPVVVVPGDQIRCGEVILNIPEEKEK
ncbi:MAG: FHA domain-containing protein [Anaerolineales bacterium]|jgi:pSer/pThr/pTyr-binding forkhead associated (FHA) protein